ncbi:MAG: phosphoserine phosphatase SerB [Alphaproteobacteria bacterium]|nr:phosphoserine phosphatase SerB [Alphaproteobacteria bacterium]NCQ88537.1 phosphoserine phosphatase SerB [Alphaproteobacteria bacterium]NCT06080.1 phosphoserine phosphatase SerB [Alphaproteobacteria bacterium]
MDYILTLVAAHKNLSAGHIAQVENFAANQAIMITDKPKWLDSHIAATIPIAECLTMDQTRILQELFDDAKIDVFCTSAKNRRKKLLLADMDSTIVTTETLDELADFVGLKEKIANITMRAMKGELDYKDSLRERVQLLKGLSTDKLKETLEQTQLTPGAEKLIKTMRENGGASILVSSGFTYFTEAVATQCGFAGHHGNILGIDNNLLDGTVAEPILDKDTKLAYLEGYKDKLSLNYEDIAAIGDGSNDIPMLSAAGLGIGFHPKPIVREAILNCILHGDLTAVLYAQGYKGVC